MTLLHSWKNRAQVTYFPSIIMVHEIFGVFLYTRNVNYLVKNEHDEHKKIRAKRAMLQKL